MIGLLLIARIEIVMVTVEHAFLVWMIILAVIVLLAFVRATTMTGEVAS